MWMLGGTFYGQAASAFVAAGQAAPATDATFLLLEDAASFFLLEDGSSKVQLE